MREIVWDASVTSYFRPPDEDVRIRIEHGGGACGSGVLELTMPHTSTVGRRVGWYFADGERCYQLLRRGTGVGQSIAPGMDGEAEWRNVDACPMCGTAGKGSASWVMVSGL